MNKYRQKASALIPHATIAGLTLMCILMPDETHMWAIYRDDNMIRGRYETKADARAALHDMLFSNIGHFVR